jgi:Alcohol dehydrogenase GroES-like domain
MKSFQVAEFNAPLKEVDQETPQPTGTQVLIKVKAAGVCHSDLHIWEGGYDLGHGRKPLSLKDRGVAMSHWFTPGSAAANARRAWAATRTCASSSRTRSASIATAAMPTT